jgi:hypothetical protein
MVEGQPLAANVRRLLEAVEYLGAPFADSERKELLSAAERHDALELQRALDRRVAVVVAISDGRRLTIEKGPAPIQLQQAGYVPVVLKILNASGATSKLGIHSANSGALYAGVAEFSMKRQAQEQLREQENVDGRTDRFLQLEMFQSSPMAARLSGLEVEYAIALIYSSRADAAPANLSFSLTEEGRDLARSNELTLPVTVKPAVTVELRVRDADGQPTIAKLQFMDKLGHVYPPQPKRLAPDLFFQPHIYRADGESVLLPPGWFTMQSSRGPEYRVQERTVEIAATKEAQLEIALERWIDPMKYGYFCGDHHIHAAGCAHYTSPTEGVRPEDMFRQVKGEGLNVGCVLTWGPCFDFQRQFFAPAIHELSEPRTLLKYDLEISGFGSQALGHVCLLGLKDQVYPGSESTNGWPSWTTPVLRWAKGQGAVTGYAHSASGLAIDSSSAAKRLIQKVDSNGNGSIDRDEASEVLLPESFAGIDVDEDKALTKAELTASHDRVAEQLPNLAVPEMNGVGAMEICVSTAEGVCDFISAMDTPRIQEWNCWYHLLNCGFPLKVSGETDFPCMSSRAVGQGRVYVHLGDVPQVDFGAWCAGLAAGRSYVSDGYAHAFEFTVNEHCPGTDNVQLEAPQAVRVRCKVAFAKETPRAVAYGNETPSGGKRLIGDTVELHGKRSTEIVSGGERLVEVIVNGAVAGKQTVPADGEIHALQFDVPIERSSWIAIRQFPQLHTNPVNVIVAGKPIRVSQRSAQWCAATIEQLWSVRAAAISAAQRQEAKATFDRATQRFRQIASEAPDNS